MQLFYALILEMNNKNSPIKNTRVSQSNNSIETRVFVSEPKSPGIKLSIPTINLLKTAVHRKTTKTYEHLKSNKTKKHISNNQRINNNSNNIAKVKAHIHNKYKKHTRYSLKRNPDYLEKLIHTYYDNDTCVSKYLASTHHKLYILPPARRIIVIGDIHGDFDAAVKCLILADCIAPIESPDVKTVENMDSFFKSLVWTGGDTQVVQLGDQIDRVRPRKWDSNSISQTEAQDDEGSTLEIFYLFWHLNQLAQQAQPTPGAIHCIIGNHEIMNVEGNFSYVSSAEFYSFKNHLSHVYYPNSKYPYHSRTLHNTRQTQKSKGLPVGYQQRLYAFSPTGLCSNFMAQNYYTLLQIGNWLFCHGSPTLYTLATYEIDLINTITAMYLLGLDANISINSSNNTSNSIEYHFDKIMNNDTSFQEPTSLIWSRTFGEIHPVSTQKELIHMLNTILATYNKKNNNKTIQNTVTHIAVGHTPQIHNNKQLGINSICNGRVWRCDIGISKAFNNKAEPNNQNNIPKKRKIQVLEILDNKTNILTG